MKTIQYGYNIQNSNIAIDKAATKKDGVYSFRGFLYRVKKFRITHIAHRGQILERFGNFDIEVGVYTYNHEARKILSGLCK